LVYSIITHYELIPSPPAECDFLLLPQNRIKMAITHSYAVVETNRKTLQQSGKNLQKNARDLCRIYVIIEP